MADNNNASHVGGYLAAFTLGAAIGAGIALLYAPRSGKETREVIAKTAREVKDKAEEALDEAKVFIREKKAEFAAAIEAGKEAVREERPKHAKNA
jgi:gas vesicle protein